MSIKKGNTTLGTSAIDDRDIDKGYAWIIMTIVFFNFFICGMVFASCSVLYYDFMQAFDSSVGAVGWIISIYCVCLFTSGMLSDVAVRKFNTRKTSMASALLAATSVFGASFSTSLVMLGTCYAITGIGIGICYVSVSSNLQKYFDRKRSMASGITSAGFSLVNCLGPLFARLLLDVYGWRGCLRMISGILMQNVWICILHRPIEKEKAKSRGRQPIKNNAATERKPIENTHSKNDITNNQALIAKANELVDNVNDNNNIQEEDTFNGYGPNVGMKYNSKQEIQEFRTPFSNSNGFDVSQNNIQKQQTIDETKSYSQCDNRSKSSKSIANKVLTVFNFKLMLNWQFLMYGISTILMNFAFVCSAIQIVNKALDDGISKTSAAIIPSFFGAINFVLRPIGGILMTKYQINRICVFGLSLIALGVCYVWVGFASTFLTIMLSMGTAAVFSATALINMHPVLVDIVGSELLTSAIGIHGLFIAIGQLAAGPVSGVVFDLTSSFDASLYLSGVAQCFAGILLLSLQLLRRQNGDGGTEENATSASSANDPDGHVPCDPKEGSGAGLVSNKLYTKSGKNAARVKRKRTVSEQAEVSSWSLAGI